MIKENKAEAKRVMTDDQFTKCDADIHVASVRTKIIPIQNAMVMELGKIFDQTFSVSEAESVIETVGLEIFTKVERGPILMARQDVPYAVAFREIEIEAIGWTAAVDFANRQKV